MNYGEFGGQYVPQNLLKRLEEIEETFKRCLLDDDFNKEYMYYLKNFVGRPSPLYFARNLSKKLGGGKIYLKREDLNHTGSHKINNAIGQILLAKRMNKKHIIAETGAGQHGVATATVCAMFDMKCTIFMGACDIKKQSINAAKMKLLGADVISVETGGKTLKDAVDAAFDYLENNDDVYYLVGSAVGPHPYPAIVKEFQKIIGDEARSQVLELCGRLPRAVIASVGGGSNSIGIFSAFINDDVDLYGIEGGGLGIDTKMHASSVANNRVAIMHGMKTFAMLDESGNIKEAHSISSGLDYPGIGPEHAYYHKTGRVIYDSITDSQALEALNLLTLSEGIIPALESSHAIAYAEKIAKNYDRDDIIIISLSGRGDKDINTVLNNI